LLTPQSGIGGSAHAQSAEHAPDTMAAHVLACAWCHGDKGHGTNDDYFPRLAGKPAGYLYNQLIAFRDGRGTRRNDISKQMRNIARQMTGSEIDEAARYYASRP
jgi:cytochrome c553